MPSTRVLQAGAQRRPRHDPRRLQPQGLRDDREWVCRDSRPVRRDRQGLKLSPSQGVGGAMQVERESERTEHALLRSTFIHTSHTSNMSSFLSCVFVCSLAFCLRPRSLVPLGMALARARAGSRREEQGGRHARTRYSTRERGQGPRATARAERRGLRVPVAADARGPTT